MAGPTVESLLQDILTQMKKGGGGTGFKSADALSALPTTSEGLTKAFEFTKDAVEKFAKSTQESLGTWRDLTNSGSNFSNDIISMSVSAAQSRLSLNDFADVVKENGKYMTGLGGSVARGTEAFAKLSKGFFDNNMDRDLRQLGYTSKDLNEILSFQASVRKSTFRDDEQSRKAAQQSAVEMAKEMDLIAKLTGRSREEQMQAMKQARVDGQIESKLRLLTAGKDAIEAQKIRDDYKEGLLEAQKNGSEQAYKEFYATGTYITEMGQTQAALLGKQIRTQEEAIKASQLGQVMQAEAKRQESAAEALKNAGNKQLLAVGAMGESAGPAGNVMTKFVEQTDTMYHAVVATANSAKIMLQTTEDYTKALNAAIAEIKKSTDGIKKGEEESTSGATRGLIEMGRAAENLKAGLASAAEAVDTEGRSLTNNIRNSGTAVQAELLRIQGDDQGKNIATIIAEQAAKGMQPREVDTTGKSRATAERLRNEASGGLIGDVVKFANTLAEPLSNAVIKGIREIGQMPGANNPAPAGGPRPEPRSGGTYGAGLTSEKVGSILEITKPGEVVLNAEQQKNLAKGIMDNGAEKAILGFKQLVGNETKNFDPKEISDQITKTISSTKSISNQSTIKIETSGDDETTTTRRVESEDSKAASKEYNANFQEFSKLKLELRNKFKEQLGPNAKSGDVRKAVSESEEFKQLAAKYKEQQDALMKRIEDGISYETEIKKAAYEETKKNVEKELTIVQTTRLKITQTSKDASDEEIIASRKLTDEQKKIRDQERAEIFKAAEAHKGVIGKSVKGMSDEAIESLLPAGSKLEDFYIDINEQLQSAANDQAKSLQKIIDNEKKITESRSVQPVIEPKIEKPVIEPTIIKPPIEPKIEKPKAEVVEPKKEIAGPQASPEAKQGVHVGQIALKPTDKEIRDKNRIEEATKLKKLAFDSEGKLNLDAINLPGMPNFGFKEKPKQEVPKTAEAQPKPDENQSAAETARLNRGKPPEAQSTTGQSQTSQTSEKPKEKSATLDDVVSSLNKLNTQMGNLITQQELLMNKQISATAANSGNVLDRMRPR